MLKYSTILVDQELYDRTLDRPIVLLSYYLSQAFCSIKIIDNGILNLQFRGLKKMINLKIEPMPSRPI